MGCGSVWSIAALMAVFAVATAPSLAAADESVALRISVHVMADIDVAPGVLRQAKQEAARIYEKLAIELLWVDDIASAAITTRIVRQPIKGAGGSAMGVAPRTSKGAGTLLFAFYGHIETYARQHDKPVAQILGHVIAHELGHLLLPHGSHSKTGIMVAQWDRAQVEQIGRGWLSFTEEQTADIRRKAGMLETVR
jgi:hypothetical protein